MSEKWLLESEIALKAVMVGADILNNMKNDGFNINTKGDPRDLVTELDLAIEKDIRNLLKDGNYPVIGEEMSSEKETSSQSVVPTWYIDPIDGTTNFVSSIPFYSVSLGLVSKNEFLVGAVVMPALKELFFTIAERGAYMNGKKLCCKPASLYSSLVAASFSTKNISSDRDIEYATFGEINDISRGCLRLGSASVNICYTAAGKLNVAYGLNNKIWDVAGSLAIAKRAGCKIFIQRNIDNPYVSFVVGSSDAADEIYEILVKNRHISAKQTEVL